MSLIQNCAKLEIFRLKIFRVKNFVFEIFEIYSSFQKRLKPIIQTD